MRIGIDVRYLSHGLLGGVHTYVANLVPALLSAAPEYDFVLYADAKAPFELVDLPPNATVRILPYRSPLSSVANDLTMRRVMAGDKLDIVHFPANYGFGPDGTRTVITLHDEINLLPWTEIVSGHPRDLGTVATMTYLHLMTDRAVRKADAVITVSEHARRKIAATGRVNANHIVSIHSAVAPDLQRVTDPQVLAEVRERYGLMKGFVLADALKNPAVLIRAWQQLSPDLRDGQEVVFFCRHSNPPLPVAQAVKEGTARLLVRPSRADLTALYSMATVFVFPSWIEGFGLPVLEAMRCGAPVISSDRGSLPEVVGDAALLMDAEDDTALAGYLTAVFSQPEVAESLRIKGSERSALFSWERAASQVLDIYSHVVSASPLVLRYVRA